ncbi:hypothetical protein AVEN_187358-1 [Araneus ventricosus]|uniref:Uncharacterized protein n=1 Tax=Araneus ventricosus TaxID=182803 RepID=A0A4Y2SEJ9_ARAVE|nr:hypothetical protein AVEN_187358-1 [Araneus ventricosus]
MYIKGTSSNQDFYVMCHHHGSPHTNHWHVGTHPGPSPFSCSLAASSSIISKKNNFLLSVKMEANAKDMNILEVYDSDTLQDRDIEALRPPHWTFTRQKLPPWTLNRLKLASAKRTPNRTI